MVKEEWVLKGKEEKEVVGNSDGREGKGRWMLFHGSRFGLVKETGSFSFFFQFPNFAIKYEEPYYHLVLIL